MKKVIAILCIFSLLMTSLYISAQAFDDSSDGVIEWMGYKWLAECKSDVSVPCKHGWMYADDEGLLNFRLVADRNKAGYIHRIEIPRGNSSFGEQIDLAENFDVEFEMKVSEFGEHLGYQMYDETYRVYLVFCQDGITYQSADGYFVQPMSIGNDWNTWKMFKRGERFCVYMNGELVISYNLPDLGVAYNSEAAVRFYATPSARVAPKMQLKSFELVQYDDVPEMTPADGETFEYGEDITFSIPAADNLQYVEYYAGQVCVGTATQAEGYRYTLSSPAAGVYKLWAKVIYSDGSEKKTFERTVFVKKRKVQAEESFSNTDCEYNLTYTYTKGAGNVCVKDGYFELNISHTESGVTYKTRDGAETYNGGAGNYRVVVSSGIAEVYRNDQLAFSVYLPRCSDNPLMEYSGVSAVTKSQSGVKGAVYYKKHTGETEISDEVIKIGEFYSLEFDKKDNSHETVILYDGEFEISLKLNGGITALTQAVNEGKIVEKKLSEKVEPGYYRLTVYKGMAQLFADNRFVASFRAPGKVHKKEIRRVMSDPDGSSFTAIKNTDDVYYFKDDFQGSGERGSGEYWYKIHGNTTANFSDGVMTLNGAGTYLLDATAENPILGWRMKINGTEPGTFESGTKETAITVRYRNEYNNVKIVYSHYKGMFGIGNKGTWSLMETVDGKSTTVATASLRLALGTIYDYSLIVKNDMLTFKCGNSTLFSNVLLTFDGNGKFGFCPVSVDSLTIDDFSYEGNGKVNSGVNYSWWTTAEFNGTTEFVRGNEENEVVMYYGGNRTGVSTSDGGETWSSIMDYSGKGYSNNVIYLQSGRKLEVSDWGNQSHASLYEADGTLVKSNSILQHTDDKVEGRMAMCGRLMQARTVYGGTAPRVFYVTSEGSEVNGTARVYFSDDEGVSWKETTTVLDFDSLGGFYAGEADIVDLPDGTIRLWLRTDRGFLHYVDSHDGGVTFDNVPVSSQFMTPSTAFSIERDPDAEQTYYIIWEYNQTTASKMYIQQPRNRTAMAVSYDGCETWEFIMEMDDRGILPTTAHMNSNVRVIDGLVYVNHSYLGAVNYSADKVIRTLVYVLDPKKINTVKRFADAHYIKSDYKTVYDLLHGQAVIPKSDGTGLIFGEESPAWVNEDGMVDAETVAKALGAELVEEQSGVILRIGDGEVVFRNGSSKYMVNGETATADSICLSGDGKFLNLQVCAEIFGKTYVETASSHLVMNDMLYSVYRDGLEKLSGKMTDELELCIEAFKAIDSTQKLKGFFEEYKVLLNLYVDFSDKSYENIYASYIELDLSGITDYETMKAAVDFLIIGEKDRTEAFLTEINKAAESHDWMAIRNLMTNVYSDILSVSADMSKVKNEEAIYRKMLGITYNSVADVENVFMPAYTTRLYEESGRKNAIALSTVSRGFEGWTSTERNAFGGATSEYSEGKNLVTLSAYEGMNGKHEEILSDIERSGGNFVLRDNIVYSSGGTVGQRFSDLIETDKDVFANNVTVNESGELVLSKTAEEGNSVMAFTVDNGMLSQGFDGAVIDITLCCDSNERLFLYFCDNSGFRYASMYFQPNSFNNMATNCNYVWKDGQYYDMKLVTAVMGYDESGQARTYANLYVKKTEDENWICAVKDKPMTLGSKVSQPQIKFMGMVNDKDVRFKKLDIKTYTRDAGNYEYINSAVSVPEVDYVYSFDYMRMDTDTPTEVLVGGADYGQFFSFEPYRITSDCTDAVSVDFGIEEDRWYRFFGIVKMTKESTYVHDKTKIVKNTLTMYAEDDEGNITLLFENLPMLKDFGRNGLSFGMKDTDKAGIRIKNIRMYNGKALDIYSVSENGRKLINVEVLNDDYSLSKGQLFVETTGIGSEKKYFMKTDGIFVEPFDSMRIDIEDEGGENKFFLWKDYKPLIPVSAYNSQE